MMGLYTKRSRMNINEAHIKDSKRNYFNLNKKKYHKLCVWSRKEHKIFIKRLLTASASRGSATSRLHYAPHYLAPLNNDLLHVTCTETYTETWQELKCLVHQSNLQNRHERGALHLYVHTLCRLCLLYPRETLCCVYFYMLPMCLFLFVSCRFGYMPEWLLNKLVLG